MGVAEPGCDFRKVKLTTSVRMNFSIRFAVLAASTSLALELSADAALMTNLAATSSLPRGAGLAAKFAGDAGLQAEPPVIFADTFEADGLGEGWDEVGN